jgi:hypothetical protein
MPRTPTEAEPARSLRLRRMAERQGLVLRKSRRRDPYALDFNQWWVIDPATNAVVAGGQWGMRPEEIEAFLTRQRAS